ncbi:YfbM family protein [Jinshanibacter sp. LJY008]|uniref:YfbM family protein n=1 Tax=Limnobaculum eriocheiris TaxID=2897391 RepID=A0A9X1MY57_9GAMM|nr:YfbM family protein [Limnobaculum eriocheiris]MCD1127029.1 YfbM family protein [Limnobaculum eriocheiris]
MGIQACYMAIDEDGLNHLIDLDEVDLVDELEELEEHNDTLDIGKMWDGLHFILTDSSASEPLEDDPLSDAIVGIHILDEENFIAAIGNNELPPIIEALKQFDLAGSKSRFDPQRLSDAEIYPDIWTSESKASLYAELEQALKELINFYQRCLDSNMHVVVSIY